MHPPVSSYHGTIVCGHTYRLTMVQLCAVTRDVLPWYNCVRSHVSSYHSIIVCGHTCRLSMVQLYAATRVVLPWYTCLRPLVSSYHGIIVCGHTCRLTMVQLCASTRVVLPCCSRVCSSPLCSGLSICRHNDYKSSVFHGICSSLQCLENYWLIISYIAAPLSAYWLSCGCQNKFL